MRKKERKNNKPMSPPFFISLHKWREKREEAKKKKKKGIISTVNLNLNNIIHYSRGINEI